MKTKRSKFNGFKIKAMSKTTIAASALLILSGYSTFAQDIITFKNGDEKRVKVTEVLPTEIKYKSFDNLDGPVYSDDKSKIFMIRYESGYKDVFPVSAPAATGTVAKPVQEQKEVIGYLSPVSSIQNPDLIITTDGDTINCNIEIVSATSISYVIKRSGFDSRASVLLSKVNKFYRSNGVTREVTNVVTPVNKSVSAKQETNDDEDEFLPQERKYGGPRMGVTFIDGGAFRNLLKADGKNNMYSQFGWQLEKRMFTTATGISAVAEFIPLIGGLDMGKVIPSASALIGVRFKNGLEFGAGPNAGCYFAKDAKGDFSPTGSFGVVIAVGMSLKSDKVYFPINLAFVPSVGKTASYVNPATGETVTQKYQTGAKISLLVGFNYRKK